MKRQKEATEKVAGDGASEAAAKEAEDNSTAEKAEGPASIVCEECDYKATTEKGLKQHKRMKHGKPQQSTLSTPETSRRPSRPRGGRYIDEKLSKADKLVFLKLSAIYRYRKMEILKLSKNYRYRKMHQILADN